MTAQAHESEARDRLHFLICVAETVSWCISHCATGFWCVCLDVMTPSLTCSPEVNAKANKHSIMTGHL
jgi:hypothetical protein